MIKNKMRFGLLVAGIACLCNATMAQSVDQGKKFLYYQRYKSANDVFDKILASNPNNIEAVYWKGQTLLATHDSAGANDLYSKALQSNGNAPLLLVGMGNVELRMHKTQDARQRFETAISLSKGKDINVLNAIGDANTDAHDGDAQYAIEKLTQATQVKNFNSAETYVLMGDAYRKLIDGGNAVQSYTKALAIDSKYAEAKYKIGKIYETQNNKEIFLPAFEDAITLDPLYAPAYFELYYYWYFRDVNKASGYLDKYIANSDPGPDVEYMKTDFLFASAKYSDAKDKAQGLITSLGDKVSPRMYKLIAYACDTLGDLACANQNIATYFTKQDPANVVPADYEERAHIKGKSTDSAVVLSAFDDYSLAISKDTLAADKARMAAEASDLARKMGNKKAAAQVAGILYSTKANPTNTDLYNWGMANYQAGNFKTSDSIFCGIYETKYPGEIYGYLWCMRSKVGEDDSLGSNGYAVDAYERLAVVSDSLYKDAKTTKPADTAKYKRLIIESYSQLAGYYNNIKKDKEKAIAYLNKILDVDPDNADAKRFISILNRASQKQPAAKPAAGAAAKPKGAAK